MAKYKCDGKDSCSTQVEVGYANPSFVICAVCNNGEAAFNCVDSGNYSCDCAACGPSCLPIIQEETPIEHEEPYPCDICRIVTKEQRDKGDTNICFGCPLI